MHYGGVMSPFNAWLIARGAATLPIRMRAHQDTATSVAQFLESHPRIERVMYPGLPDHPQHALARCQMNNFSGMMTFRIKGDARAGEQLAASMATDLNIVHYAVSLGHHRSLVCWMPTDAMLNNSFNLQGDNAQAYREWAGDGVFRLSVGLEDADDICADLAAVLDT